MSRLGPARCAPTHVSGSSWLSLGLGLPEKAMGWLPPLGLGLVPVNDKPTKLMLMILKSVCVPMHVLVCMCEC